MKSEVYLYGNEFWVIGVAELSADEEFQWMVYLEADRGGEWAGLNQMQEESWLVMKGGGGRKAPIQLGGGFTCGKYKLSICIV